jgi:hypothetical protein
MERFDEREMYGVLRDDGSLAFNNFGFGFIFPSERVAHSWKRQGATVVGVRVQIIEEPAAPESLPLPFPFPVQTSLPSS